MVLLEPLSVLELTIYRLIKIKWSVLKLWIIHGNASGYAKIVAGMLQDYLENYFEVSVGTARKIDPALVIEEEPDALIIGDNVCSTLPSEEVRNWLVNFSRLLENKKFHIKSVSIYCINTFKENKEPIWSEFFHNHINGISIHNSILSLKLNQSNYTLEREAPELIKQFSIDFTKSFLNDKKSDIID